MKDKVQRHMEICQEMNALYERKNHDYGDSFHKSYQDYGMTMLLIRLEDKLNRLKTLSKKAAEVPGESIQDTLIDLANYSVMGIIELEETMKTQILKIKGDWEEVANDCRYTVGKQELGHEPSSRFKTAILIAEHSPIRSILIKWRWPNMPHWVTVHWARHKWEKFIRTQRSDRTGVARDKLPQDEPQDFTGEANLQHLIDTMRKRLCFQASPETRRYAEDLKLTLKSVQPEVSDVLVPNCFYRGSCPEMKSCGLWDKMLENMSVEDILNLGKRYGVYNSWLAKKHGEA